MRPSKPVTGQEPCPHAKLYRLRMDKYPASWRCYECHAILTLEQKEK